MLKRILISSPKEHLLKPTNETEPERYELEPVDKDKKAFKAELYSLLLEIMQEEISKSVKGG